jgi:hypothetical protein
MTEFIVVPATLTPDSITDDPTGQVGKGQSANPNVWPISWAITSAWAAATVMVLLIIVGTETSRNLLSKVALEKSVSPLVRQIFPGEQFG